jgi:hypothetical protein
MLNTINSGSNNSNIVTASKLISSISYEEIDIKELLYIKNYLETHTDYLQWKKMEMIKEELRK